MGTAFPIRSPASTRLRVSRARLGYTFERYASPGEIESVDDAATRLGTTREALALLIARGRLAVVEPLKSDLANRPPRFLLSAEVDILAAH
ncbi:MAG: hypothetical protein EPO26_01390 [Chloroflexota bacterium]|nr:MAG: hypothetical protein EPO26_01390 [Chloroflexota bacterium]